MGAAGGLPITIPGSGTLKVKDGYIVLYIIAPAGGDLPDLVDWMREEGKAGDLDDEPYRTLISNLNMGWLTQLMGAPEEAAKYVPLLPHVNELIGAFFAEKTAREAYEEGQGRRLLIGIVSTPADLAQNRQLRQHKVTTEVERKRLRKLLNFRIRPDKVRDAEGNVIKAEA